jgi:hypothetical protein
VVFREIYAQMTNMTNTHTHTHTGGRETLGRADKSNRSILLDDQDDLDFEED